MFLRIGQIECCLKLFLRMYQGASIYQTEPAVLLITIILKTVYSRFSIQ